MSIQNLLEGQVAIITGASRGVGQATALTLAEAGAAVVLAARNEGQLTSVNDEIKRTGHDKTLAIPTDVSDMHQVDHLLVLTLRAFGRVDILVNNAAVVQPLGKVWETSPSAWQRSIAINVIGPYLCARAVLPHMLERGSGRIINVSSGVAEINVTGTSAYNTSKAALERFTGTLAAEVANNGIVVTTFRPGIVDTPMQAEIRQTPTHLFPRVAEWQAHLDEGRLRPPVEPARGILWLASHFAKNSNGQLFNNNEAFQQRITADLGPANQH